MSPIAPRIAQVGTVPMPVMPRSCGAAPSLERPEGGAMGFFHREPNGKFEVKDLILDELSLTGDRLRLTGKGV